MMSNSDKVNKLLKTSRDPQELQDWMFSLAPLGVAFAFFLVFVWSVNLPHKDVIVITGVAAGFIGLESYWMIRGWRKNHIVTILLGGWGLLQHWRHAGFTWPLPEAAMSSLAGAWRNITGRGESGVRGGGATRPWKHARRRS